MRLWKIYIEVGQTDVIVMYERFISFRFKIKTVCKYQPNLVIILSGVIQLYSSTSVSKDCTILLKGLRMFGFRCFFLIFDIFEFNGNCAIVKLANLKL